MVKLRYAQRHSTCSCRKVQIKLVPVNKSHVIWSVSSSCLLTRNIYRKYCHNERRSVLKRDVDCKCVSLKDKMQARACTLEHLDQRSLKGFSCLLHDNLVLLPFSKMNLEFSKNWVYHQMPFSHTVGTWRGGCGWGMKPYTCSSGSSVLDVHIKASVPHIWNSGITTKTQTCSWSSVALLLWPLHWVSDLWFHDKEICYHTLRSVVAVVDFTLAVWLAAQKESKHFTHWSAVCVNGKRS